MRYRILSISVGVAIILPVPHLGKRIRSVGGNLSLNP